MELIRYALDLADKELHNQIATCPDIFEYADDIEDIEEERRTLKKILDRIDKKLEVTK